MGYNIATTLCENIKQIQIEVANQTVNVSCSMGMAYYKGKTDVFDTLYEQADVALYQAKNAGKNSVVVFSENLQQARKE